MQVINEFSSLYTKKRQAGFNCSRAFKTSLAALEEKLITWSYENAEPINKDQYGDLIRIKHDRSFLQVLEDTFDLNANQKAIYFNLEPKLQRVK